MLVALIILLVIIVGMYYYLAFGKQEAKTTVSTPAQARPKQNKKEKR